jgi:hypothetical protein
MGRMLAHFPVSASYVQNDEAEYVGDSSVELGHNNVRSDSSCPLTFGSWRVCICFMARRHTVRQAFTSCASTSSTQGTSSTFTLASTGNVCRSCSVMVSISRMGLQAFMESGFRKLCPRPATLPSEFGTTATLRQLGIARHTTAIQKQKRLTWMSQQRAC